MPTFRKNYLSPESQDWVREVESRTVALEYSLTRTNANLRSTEIQLNSSYNRLDSAVTTLQDNQADIQTALADAQSAINSVLGLGSPGGDPVDGGNLINGTVPGAKIVANSITANQIASNSITSNEISSNYVYAGTIDADQINAGTLTGFTINTAPSGKRIQILGTGSIQFYDSSNVFAGFIQGGTSLGDMTISSSGNLSIFTGRDMVLYATTGDIRLSARDGLRIDDAAGNYFDSFVNSNGQLETSEGFRIATGGALNVASGAQINYAAPTSASGSPVYKQTNNLLVEFTSSREYKTEIEDISFDYEKLLNVEMKSFKYKDDITRYGDEALRVYGYIAEDLHDSGLTDLVIYKRLKDGTDVPHSLQFNSLNAIYHSVVQMHHKKIAELEQKVTELENG